MLEIEMDFKQWNRELGTNMLGGTAVELCKCDNAISAMERISETAGATNPQGIPLRASHVIPFAAEKYNISPHIRDYAAVPVIIMPSDLPNRNKVGFPIDRLSEFDPNAQQIAYETWRYAPTHMEHDNADYAKAKGIVFDVGIRPMRTSSGLWKVNALLAFDRTRDPNLVNDILSGRRTAYSMGAYVAHYECSVCGRETSNKARPACDHIDPTSPRMQVYACDGKMRLAHWNTGPFRGFEVSSVSTPAYTSAVNPEIIWK